MKRALGGTDDSLSANAMFAGDLSSLRLETEYRSLKDNPVERFYRQCLRNSSTYKRAAGYFRSSVFVVIGPTLIEFSKRGGRTRLICSPELDREDIDSIALGYASRSDRLADRLVSLIDELLANERTAYATRVLATLVQVGSLDIKLALRADRKGLYHEKIGVFSDPIGNRVSFKGSANETWSGWHDQGNFESIEVFCDWRGGLERERVQRHEAHFDSLWSERDRDVEVFAFPSKAADQLKKAAFRGLPDLTQEPTQPSEKKRRALPHQENAHQKWIAAGCRGIFEHATGSGKTFTAILVIREHLAKGLPALVLVPSTLLLEQWAREIRDELPEAALLLAGGGHDGWRSAGRLRAMTDPDPEFGGRLILATMQTAAGEEFTTRVEGGDHLLIVADEVHQIGSPQNSRAMQIQAGARLGLSATPTRYGDPEGTARLFSYFGPVIPPPISLQDAITAGRLVPYEYYPHPVNLSAEEAQSWADLTKAIGLEFRRSKSAERAVFLSERAKMLLIRRSRIAKKAGGKVHLAVKVVGSHFEEGQSWLIYCEDSSQLNQVRSALTDEGFKAAEYHSAMQGDRNATLSWFKSFGGILVSIRCLDEGVDIPSISHALILASSQNPRQFIQRRGRVLRKSQGKEIAVIHDAIVVPTALQDADRDQHSLLRSEIGRALQFADHAINRGAGADLREIEYKMGLSVGIQSDEEFEEE